MLKPFSTYLNKTDWMKPIHGQF